MQTHRELSSEQDYTFRQQYQSKVPERYAIKQERPSLPGHRQTPSNSTDDNLILLKTPHLRPSLDTSKHHSGAYNEKETSEGFYQRYLMKCDQDTVTSNDHFSMTKPGKK